MVWCLATHWVVTLGLIQEIFWLCDRNSPNTHSQSIACPSCQFWQNMFSNTLRKTLLIWQNRCLNQILLNLWLTDWEWREPGTCCAGEAAPSRLFILFVDALLIMIYEVKLFHLQHQKPEYHSALCGEKLLFKIQS